MKIAFVLSSLSTGGLEMQTIKLANSLSETEGWEVHIIVLRNINNLEYLINPFVKLTYIVSRSFYDRKCFRQLAEFFRTEKFNFVFAEEMYAGLYCSVAAGKSRTAFPKALVIHTTVLPDISEKIKNMFYKHLANAFQYRIFVSENQRSYWVRKYGIREDNTFVIHNGVETEAFNIKNADNELLQAIRQEFSITGESFTIVKCGRLVKEKNDIFLIKAAEQLKKKTCADIKVLIVGGGPEQATLEKYIVDSGLGGSVFLTGVKKDVKPYIAAADIGTLPSYATETFSMAALEQMSMGKPMLMSDIGGASEMVHEGINGFLFSNNDMADYTSKLERLIEMKENGTLRQMGDRASEMVLKNFSHKAMVDKYKDFLNRFIAKI